MFFKAKGSEGFLSLLSRMPEVFLGLIGEKHLSSSYASTFIKFNWALFSSGATFLRSLLFLLIFIF